MNRIYYKRGCISIMIYPLDIIDIRKTQLFSFSVFAWSKACLIFEETAEISIAFEA